MNKTNLSSADLLLASKINQIVRDCTEGFRSAPTWYVNKLSSKPRKAAIKVAGRGRRLMCSYSGLGSALGRINAKFKSVGLPVQLVPSRVVNPNNSCSNGGVNCYYAYYHLVNYIKLGDL